MSPAKEPMVIEVFEDLGTIFFNMRYPADQELCDAVMNIAGVSAVTADSYQLCVMLGDVFSPDEVGPQVLATICIKLGIPVSHVQLKPSRSVGLHGPAEPTWILEPASRLQKDMTLASLQHIIEICDEELAAHAKATKSLRSAKATARRRLAKLVG